MRTTSGDEEQDEDTGYPRPSPPPPLVDRTSPTTPLLQPEHRHESDDPDPSPAASSSSLPRTIITRTALSRTLSLMLAPVTGEEGPGSVWMGLTTLFLVGGAIGLLLAPHDHALPTPWYRVLSAGIGYTYFLCWSVSFYPQVLTNFRRKTTAGLSADFCALNVLGFACYAAYNLSLFYSPAIQREYRNRHGEDSEITVRSNDVAFAVHAFLIASATLFQIGYYDGFRVHTSNAITTVLVTLVVVICTAPVLVVASNKLEWLDYLYVLSYVKIVITLIKYVPQMVLNIRRRSTHGFSKFFNLVVGCRADTR